MNVLIVKLGATGDVVRTTPLLQRLNSSITWITAAKNCVLLDGLADNLRHSEARARRIPYDLIIIWKTVSRAFPVQVGRDVSYADSSERLSYTDNSNPV